MNGYHSRAERAADLLRGGLTVADAAERTGLSVSIVEEINKPIARRKAERDALDSAERAMRDAERRLLRERQPCPLCETGYAHPFDLDVCSSVGRRDHDGAEIRSVMRWMHPYWCECSNPRCIARNLYPAHSEQEAIERFCAGDFNHEDYFVDREDDTRYWYSAAGYERMIQDQLIPGWPADQIKRLGIDPDLVDRLELMHDMHMLVDHPEEALSLTLMCPRCGAKGEYRPATSPVTHRKTWWRIGCKKCKARLRYAFPSQREAEAAWADGELEAKPEPPERGRKTEDE